MFFIFFVVSCDDEEGAKARGALFVEEKEEENDEI
jgi:hypothetical protein